MARSRHHEVMAAMRVQRLATCEAKLRQFEAQERKQREILKAAGFPSTDATAGLQAACQALSAACQTTVSEQCAAGATSGASSASAAAAELPPLPPQGPTSKHSIGVGAGPGEKDASCSCRAHVRKSIQASRTVALQIVAGTTDRDRPADAADAVVASALTPCGCPWGPEQSADVLQALAELQRDLQRAHSHHVSMAAQQSLRASQQVHVIVNGASHQSGGASHLPFRTSSHAQRGENAYDGDEGAGGSHAAFRGSDKERMLAGIGIAAERARSREFEQRVRGCEREIEQLRQERSALRQRLQRWEILGELKLEIPRTMPDSSV